MLPRDLPDGAGRPDAPNLVEVEEEEEYVRVRELKHEYGSVIEWERFIRRYVRAQDPQRERTRAAQVKRTLYRIIYDVIIGAVVALILRAIGLA